MSSLLSKFPLLGLFNCSYLYGMQNLAYNWRWYLVDIWPLTSMSYFMKNFDLCFPLFVMVFLIRSRKENGFCFWYIVSYFVESLLLDYFLSHFLKSFFILFDWATRRYKTEKIKQGKNVITNLLSYFLFITANIYEM